MCLAIPGKILSIAPRHESEPLMGEVSFAGVRRSVCLDWVPDAVSGQYVLVHVGFALSVVDEAEAEETLRLMKEANLIEHELGPGPGQDNTPEDRAPS